MAFPLGPYHGENVHHARHSHQGDLEGRNLDANEGSRSTEICGIPFPDISAVFCKQAQSSYLLWHYLKIFCHVHKSIPRSSLLACQLSAECRIDWRYVCQWYAFFWLAISFVENGWQHLDCSKGKENTCTLCTLSAIQEEMQPFFRSPQILRMCSLYFTKLRSTSVDSYVSFIPLACERGTYNFSLPLWRRTHFTESFPESINSINSSVMCS